ncbi:MAG TPA: hypothetical protein VGL89_08695 [Candidatus Koribacter sp.]|jgi:hypothetical protein
MNKLTIVVAILLTLLLVPASFGQGCALCYTQAAGSGPKMIQALRSGILVLMFPPMGICVLFTWMGYKKRNKYFSAEEEHKRVKDQNGPNADLGW